MNQLDTALRYHDAGLAPLPLRTDGSKAPAVGWRDHLEQPPTRAQVEAWFSSIDTDGIGTICGAAAGQLEMLEVEGRAVHLAGRIPDLMTGHGLTDLWHRIATGWVHSTPSGGLHWHYRISDGSAEHNRKLARTADGLVTIETRGQGGFTVLPPSAGRSHPTGNAWVSVHGDATTIPAITTEERDALHLILGLLDEAPPAADPIPLQHATSSSSGTRPGDDYNARASWDDILSPRGWKPIHRFGRAVGWRRPGKNVGISATTGRNDADNLYVFSTSTEFTAEKPYSKFAAYTLLEHRGDWSAAARALLTAGYGQRTPLAPVPTTPVTTQAAVTTPDTATAGATALVVAQPAPVDATAYGPTEDGTARALVALHGHQIRYCPQRGRWLVWNGHKWAWDEGELVREYVRTVARGLPDGEGWRSYKKRALSAAGVTGITRLAQTDQQVIVHIAHLDARPYELNTPAGTIDLRTGQLHPADPSHLHTRCTAISPDFDRRSELFDQFITDTFDSLDLAAYVQRLLGISSIGTVLEQILPFAHGAGANGKSTLAEVAMHCLGRGDGGYAITAPAEMLMVRKHTEHPAELAQLAGARLVVCSELDDGQRFAEARLKQLTGRDSINARFMRQDPFTFTPTHTIWLLGNQKPNASTGGPAFWRRVQLIPFENVIPENKRDPHLSEKLEAEAPAILAWIARGAADYMTGGLRVPDQVKAATADYARDQDTIGRFVDERCHLAPGRPELSVDVSTLRSAYEQFCLEDGDTPASARRLTQELHDRFGIDRSRRKDARTYLGIGLRRSVTHDDERDDAGADQGWFR